MYITVLGSCRQESIDTSKFTILPIKSKISYPHYTKEIIEVINFCKYGLLKPEETLYTFRTAILNNKPIYFTKELKDEFESTDIFLIEISSKKSYRYNNKYVHHILYEYKDYNTNYKNKIIYTKQDDLEIEQDILKIKELLKKPFIIISHIIIDNKSSRYELGKLLENICLKHDIIYLNPVKEINKLGYNINNLIVPNQNAIHYNNNGKQIIKNIYTEFINIAIKKYKIK